MIDRFRQSGPRTQPIQSIHAHPHTEGAQRDRPMNRKSVLILLTPDAVHAALLKCSAVVQQSYAPIEREPGASIWETALTHADGALAQCVQELDAPGALATVIYTSPTAFVDVFHCTTTGQSLANAANLALLDRATIDQTDAQSGVYIWGRDHCKQSARSHAIIAAETNTTAATVASWVERAGLSLVRATPIDAAATAHALADLASINTPTPTIRIHIGEHVSTLGVVRDGAILLARRIGLTRDALVQTLLRPIIAADDQSNQTNLSAEQAKQIINESGIPAPNDTIASGAALKGRDVLPLLQPLLQRFVVETKQLLRFGIDQDNAAGAALCVTFTGDPIPKLADILAEQLECPLSDIAPQTAFDSDLELCATDFRCTPDLAPAHVRAAVARGHFKKALIAGTILAGAVAGIDAMLTQSETGALRAQAHSLSPDAQAAQAILETKSQAIESKARVDTLRAEAIEAIGPQADIAAAYAELALLTPEWVRIASLSTNRANEGVTISLEAHAMTHTDSEHPDVEQYIATLQSSPLIDSVELGATQATTLDRARALRFSAQINLVTAPANIAIAWEDVQ